VTAIPRQIDVRRLLQDIGRRLATLERGQRSTAQLAERVTELESRLDALEGE